MTHRSVGVEELAWTSAIGGGKQEVRQEDQDRPGEVEAQGGHSDPPESAPARAAAKAHAGEVKESTPAMRPISAYVLPQARDNPSELLRNRLLCRGGAMLLVGPTGIGKSSFVLQACVRWALGQEFFGIEPARELRCLLVQAENDDGDIAEMRDGVYRGLLASGHMLEDDPLRLETRIAVACEDSRTGREFGVALNRMLDTHKPDLLIIDPALAYLGGDALKQADVTLFCRNILNPIIHRHQCGLILVHHTNKPPRGEEKGDWKAGDLAYLGQGAADWANWARAVVAIRTLGSHSVFELCLGKRGRRAGWRDQDGRALFSKYIAHSKDPDSICWREPDASEVMEESTGSVGTDKKDWARLQSQAIEIAMETVRTRDQLKAECLRRIPDIGPESAYDRNIRSAISAAKDDGKLEFAGTHDGAARVHLVGPAGGSVGRRKDEIEKLREAKKQRELQAK